MCSDEYSSGADDNPSCSDSGHECGDNCCTHHGNYFKLKQDQQLTAMDMQVPAPPVVVLPGTITPLSISSTDSQLWPSWLSFKPPIVEPQIWLKLETFRC